MRTPTDIQPGPSVSLIGVAAGGPGRVYGVTRMGRPRKQPVKTVNGVNWWRCSVCKKPKPETEFHPRKGRSCPRSHCKPCELEYKKQHYARQREALGHVVGEERSSKENWSSVDRASAEWKKRNKERVNKRIRDYRHKFPDRARAREAVHNALNSGRLVKPTECEMCGASGRRLVGHHSSYTYDRRLVVIWLCSKCHSFLHKQIDEQAQIREVAAAESPPEPASRPTQTSVFDVLGEAPYDTEP